MLVIIEESYRITAWCGEIIDGLRQEARKKRVNLTFSSNVEDIDGCGEDMAVMIVGSAPHWLSLAAGRARGAGKHPIILSNQSENAFDGNVSCVTVDLRGSMSAICRFFSERGLKKLALYAINPASASDVCRKDSFLSSGGAKKNVFINDGSLSECFNVFYTEYASRGFDGIICANDFAAISLIRHLQEVGEPIDGLNLISYSNTLVSQCFSPSISSVATSYSGFGQLAFMIVDCLSKSNFVSGIRINGKWELIHRDTTSALSKSESAAETAVSPIPSPQKNVFFDDSEVMDIVRAENLLSECDNTDLEIIEMILDGKKTAEIEKACYLTETAVKYRIKKMKEQCNASSRDELRVFLSRYVTSLESIKQ